MYKRVTKRQWQEAREAMELGFVLDAAEGMIDRGEAWLPEPVTEADICRWAVETSTSGRGFILYDLPDVMDKCVKVGLLPEIQRSTLGNTWIAIPDRRHNQWRQFDSLLNVTRYLAIYAYKKAHPDADVEHLLEGME